MKKSVKINLVVMLLIALTVGALSIFFGGAGHDVLVYSEGRPWNYPKLIAPFDIPIEYDSVSAQKIKDSIDSNFAPIYNINEARSQHALETITSSVDSMSGVPSGTKQRIKDAAAQVFQDGIVDNTTSNKISKGSIKTVRVINGMGNESQTVDGKSLRSTVEAYGYIDSVAGIDLIQGAEIASLIHGNLVPNLEYDSVKSDAVLDDAYQMALAPHGVKLTGERIIDYGEIVTAQKFTLLKTYERMSAERNTYNVVRRFSVIGNLVVIALLLFVMYLYIRIMHPSVYRSLRHMTFLFCFVFFFVLLVYIIAHLRSGLLYLIPFALVPIVVTVFFNISLGFFTHMIVVLISSLVAPEASDFIIMQFLAGIIALLSIKGLMQRSQLVVCAFLIFLCYTVTYGAQYIARNGTFDAFDWHVILYFAVNCIVLSFAYFGIFIVEKIFGFTSQVTLVELSDINNPVLRELSENCPGTFQHSLQVATLAGEAARQVGANVQLVRAGALYHDIGKIDNPAFFTENQSGVNPHDVLQPEQSASIVISHVTDGLERAERANLPQVIKDLIAQHHGKGVTRYFYAMACKASESGTVDPAPFTYPGPNPRSREAAILMMADASEAAVKSLPVPSEENITNMVNRIVDSQVSSGLFNESPISFKDISTVKESLIKRLLTFYHTRVSYPDEVRPEESQDAEVSADENITAAEE
jgi:hypothetical protein